MRLAWIIPSCLALLTLVALCTAPAASAYDEIRYPSTTFAYPTLTPPLPPYAYATHAGANGPWNAECAKCHGPVIEDTCESCHNPTFYSLMTSRNSEGPHGYYTGTTSFCGMCHATHDSGGAKLLTAATMTANCLMCHDGTGGQGVYGTIQARLGTAAPGGHRIDVTSLVPGADWNTGGSASASFKGVGGTLTCVDCHTPHGQNMVARFIGERADRPYWLNYGMDINSTRMLRQRPGGSVTPVTEYGSDWCLACHGGRSSGGMVNNHPVDSKVVRADPYTYSNLPVVAAPTGNTAPTATQQLRPMASIWWDATAIAPWLFNPSQMVARKLYYVVGGNGYLMPYPRTALQAGRGPICQQCHEDSREPGYLDASGAAVVNWTRVFGADGLDPADNPRFQIFPHETENANMTIETGDDLCMNCHPPTLLP